MGSAPWYIQVKDLLISFWCVLTRFVQCDERLLTQGEAHYCQKRLGHSGKCKTHFGREFN